MVCRKWRHFADMDDNWRPLTLAMMPPGCLNDDVRTLILFHLSRHLFCGFLYHIISTFYLCILGESIYLSWFASEHAGDRIGTFGEHRQKSYSFLRTVTQVNVANHKNKPVNHYFHINCIRTRDLFPSIMNLFRPLWTDFGPFFFQETISPATISPSMRLSPPLMRTHEVDIITNASSGIHNVGGDERNYQPRCSSEAVGGASTASLPLWADDHRQMTLEHLRVRRSIQI
jgi:hypothetical protein